MIGDGNDRMILRLRENDLDWREIDDEVVALDSKGAVYLAVKGSGAVLWRLLSGSTTHEGLVDALVEQYGIDAKRAAADVDEFLATLREHGLLSS